MELKNSFGRNGMLSEKMPASADAAPLKKGDRPGYAGPAGSQKERRTTVLGKISKEKKAVFQKGVSGEKLYQSILQHGAEGKHGCSFLPCKINRQ